VSLTAGDLAVIRSWISDKEPPTDGDLTNIHARLGSLKGVVMEVLRKRLAQFQAEPASFNADDYGQTVSANLTSLRQAITDLEGLDDSLQPMAAAGGGATVQRLRRPGRRR